MVAAEHLLEVVEQVRILGERRAEIGAGAEVTARAREHHASHLGITRGRFERLCEDREHAPRERVARLRTVQRERGGATLLDDDVGAPLLLSSTLGTMFGINNPDTAWTAIATLPIFAWELSVGLWMTFKGFNVAAAAALGIGDSDSTLAPSTAAAGGVA